MYGTLMHPGVVRNVLGRGCGFSPARLAGYEWRSGRWPYVVPRAGVWVEGRLLTGLSVADFTRLDKYEAARPEPIAGARRQLYRREIVNVTARSRLMPVWVYLPNLEQWPAYWL
ncbi:MAG: gamma-glutamylcyclotransferase [Acetobacteraceae bacterium]|nr:gamma-glutamylcyclotransferase [Acetobacteraceae bacterium]